MGETEAGRMDVLDPNQLIERIMERCALDSPFLDVESIPEIARLSDAGTEALVEAFQEGVDERLAGRLGEYDEAHRDRTLLNRMLPRVLENELDEDDFTYVVNALTVIATSTLRNSEESIYKNQAFKLAGDILHDQEVLRYPNTSDRLNEFLGSEQYARETLLKARLGLVDAKHHAKLGGNAAQLFGRVYLGLNPYEADRAAHFHPAVRAEAALYAVRYGRLDDHKSEIARKAVDLYMEAAQDSRARHQNEFALGLYAKALEAVQLLPADQDRHLTEGQVRLAYAETEFAHRPKTGEAHVYVANAIESAREFGEPSDVLARALSLSARIERYAAGRNKQGGFLRTALENIETGRQQLLEAIEIFHGLGNEEQQLTALCDLIDIQNDKAAVLAAFDAGEELQPVIRALHTRSVEIAKEVYRRSEQLGEPTLRATALEHLTALL